MKMENRPLLRRDTTNLETRTIELDQLRALDTEARTVEATLSTDAVLDLGYRRERLIHERSAVDLTRAESGLPLLFGHNQADPIGIVEKVRLAGNKLVGLLRFGNSERASQVFQDVKDGILRAISIGYRITDPRANGDIVEARRWELFEASIVTVPADRNALLMRNGPDSGDGNVTDFATAAAQAAHRRGVSEGVQLEIARRNAIVQLFTMPAFTGEALRPLQERALAEAWTVDRTRAELLTNIGTQQVNIGGNVIQQSQRAGSSFQAGQDEREKMVEGAELAILVRAGLGTDEQKKTIRTNEFVGMSMVEIAREFLRRSGASLAGMSRDRVVSLALQQRTTIGLASGDFTGLLENIANKSLLRGYEEAEETWKLIARSGSIPDFREATRVGLSEFDDLPIVTEGAEFTVGSFGDRVERLRLETRGKLCRITRQAIVNDDQDAFTAIPRKMGRAASRAIGDMVINVLLNNAVLNQDGLALFVAGHNNIQSPGAAPTVAQLSAMKTLMARQKDSASQANGLNIPLTRVLVPRALEYTARTLQTASNDPAIALNPGTPNIHANTFITIADARLDAASSIIWYGLADPNLFDTIEVAFLDGQETPFLDSQDGWTVDGAEFKVRLDAVAKALDFRTMVRNAGV